MGFDVIIVGAGPAGLFAALELAERKKVLVVDWGKDISKRSCPQMSYHRLCYKCKPCNIMCGVGGAGTFSDGILNLRLDLGLDKLSSSVLSSLVGEVDDTFLRFGAPEKVYGMDEKAVKRLDAKAKSAGIRFIALKQRHMGTENAFRIIKNFSDYLKARGVKFLPETKVEDILVKDGICVGVKTSKGSIKADKVLLAPGRIGASWINQMRAEHKIKFMFSPIDVGVRVEAPSRIMDSVVKVNRDPKFHIISKTYGDFVRTFCTNHQGFVVEERYDNFSGVNGHSMVKKKSANTNFAFLVKIALTEPVEDTLKYGTSIAELATTIGGGRPMIQRLGDLRSGRRSHKKDIENNRVRNTLKDVTPGDISMALPHRVVLDIVEGLEKLDAVIPGVCSDSTLLYAPEIKLYSVRLEVNDKLETSIRNLFAAGDGCGLSRDIVNASATGILAARGMLEK
ncbi:MAG: NAD(P)/FAD-dependent oxidoreductase [Candidatus Altiarchaeota archaeon]